MKNTIHHVCPHCLYVIVAECANDADYARVMIRSEKVLEEHMINKHHYIYKESKKRRNEYG